jgi:NAD(P)-dependent dehydrogenase (short-subunit alcohol dehydrogenase family)
MREPAKLGGLSAPHPRNVLSAQAHGTLAPMPQPSWGAGSVPDLGDKTVLVTGANSGIGFHAASVFAQRGAQVLLGCRDARKADEAMARIRAETPSARISFLELNLADLASVRRAALQVCDSTAQLDILCNNAGVMAVPRTVTVDGFELQFAVNHLGHFALTGLVLEKLLAAPAARIVNVASTAHRIGHIRFDDLDGASHYNKWGAYAQSKLANLLFTFELQRRLAQRGSRAIAVACHPGYANTQLQGVGPAMENSKFGVWFFAFANKFVAQSAHKGAWPTLYAATSPDVHGGDYIGPAGPAELYGPPKKVRANVAAYDESTAQQLWQVSIERTGVSY